MPLEEERIRQLKFEDQERVCKIYNKQEVNLNTVSKEKTVSDDILLDQNFQFT